MNILFLDDDKNRQRTFRSAFPAADIVSTANECIDMLDASKWDLVCLDHDLGGEQYVDPAEKNTGMEVVRWIESNRPSVGRFIVHSLNFPARWEMTTRLDHDGYGASQCPFGPNLISFIEYLKGEEQ